jgi:hypothetical protein
MGLELAWKRDFKNLIVQDGKKTVADALQGSPLKSKQGSTLARHILLLLQHFKEVHSFTFLEKLLSVLIF